jgi:S1-C subfamily serine protease
LENQLQAVQPPIAEATADEEIGYLGIVADNRQDGGAGVVVLDVVSGSPADRAGLRIGDQITAIDGQAVGTMREFAATMLEAKPEQRVSFMALRGGKPYEILVTLGKRPAPGQRKFPLVGQPGGPALPGLGGPPLAGNPTPRKRLLGVRTIPLTEHARQFFQLPVSRGALVVAVTPGSAAEQAGIPLDAVIVAVDGHAVGDPAELAHRVEAAGAGAEVELSFYSRGALDKRRVTLRDLADAAQQPESTVRALPQPVAEDEPPADEKTDLAERLRRLEQRLGRLEAILQRMLPQAGAAPGFAAPGET